MTTSIETFGVLLSQSQRRVVGTLIPELAQRLQLQEKNGRVIQFSVSEMKSIATHAEASLRKANHASLMIHHSTEFVVEAIRRTLKEKSGIGAIPISSRLYQFKITLLKSNPNIWRRIQVRHCTLDKLHEHIQTAMGWMNCHLNQFEIDGERYGDPDLIKREFEEDRTFTDSTVTSLDTILPKDAKPLRFEYLYDFGDCWNHEILFEGCLKATKGNRYPICVEGERACPPEDMGGIHGYERFLAMLAHPNQEEHDDCIQWRKRFDPEQFDSVAVTKKMQRGLPDWRKAARREHTSF